MELLIRSNESIFFVYTYHIDIHSSVLFSGIPSVCRFDRRGASWSHTHGSGWVPHGNMRTVWRPVPCIHLHPTGLPCSVCCGAVLNCTNWYPKRRTRRVRNTGHRPRYMCLISGQKSYQCLVQDYSISSALAMDVLESCTKPSISFTITHSALHLSFELTGIPWTWKLQAFLKLLDWLEGCFVQVISIRKLLLRFTLSVNPAPVVMDY